MGTLRKWSVPAMCLTLKPHDISHARQYKHEATAKTDCQRPGQASLHRREVGNQRLVRILEPIPIPCLELRGPFQDFLLERNHLIGDHVLPPAQFVRSSCE